MKPTEFWETTPYEFGLKLEGYLESKVERRQEIVCLAWHVEALARQKRLPSLKKLLKDSKIQKKENSHLSIEQLMRIAQSKGLQVPRQYQNI